MQILLQNYIFDLGFILYDLTSDCFHYYTQSNGPGNIKDLSSSLSCVIIPFHVELLNA